jgi:hypothetical protein
VLLIARQLGDGCARLLAVEEGQISGKEITTIRGVGEGRARGAQVDGMRRYSQADGLRKATEKVEQPIAFLEPELDFDVALLACNQYRLCTCCTQIHCKEGT